MEFRYLPNSSVRISAVGLGAMPLSLTHRPQESVSIQVIHRALDLGVNLIDTADAYCIDESDKHHNEKLIAKALSVYKGDFGGSASNVDEVIVATKGGCMRPGGSWTVNGDPAHIRQTIKESFDALGGARPIPLWQLHSPDPKIPIEKTLEPVKEAVDIGLIKHVGLSNVTVEQIQRAEKIVPIVSVQNQFNPWCRRPERDGSLEYCEKNNIIFLPWSPVGGSHRHKKLLHVKELNEVAHELSCSVYSMVLAWLRHKSPVVVVIPGASKVTSIEDSVSSLKIKLSSEQMAKLDSICDPGQ